MDIKEKVSLAPISTFRIGGVAKYFIEVKTREELTAAYSFAVEKSLPVLFFSGGSNILVADGVINAVVVRVMNSDLAVQDTRIKVGAGASFSKAVVSAQNEDLTGLEWAIGIPGSVGGAIRGNAGAFGESIMSSVETVTAYNIKKESFEIFSNKDCEFSYRSSFFKQSGNYIVWEVIFKMQKAKRSDIQATMDKYLSHRRSTQPMLPSAGCIFKNLRLDDIREVSPRLADFIEKEGKTKGGMVASGWLIEFCGLSGTREGDAKVSLEHCNFIVNTRNANAKDVRTLIEKVKKSVMDRFGIQLEEELQYFGF